MPTEKTLYACFSARNRSLGAPVPVASERDAVWMGMGLDATNFTTFEIASAAQGPENFSGRRFLNVDRLYTSADVIGVLEAELAGFANLKGRFNKATVTRAWKATIRAYKDDPPGTLHIANPDNEEEEAHFIKLTPMEKAFDKNAALLWPLTAKPGLIPAP